MRRSKSFFFFLLMLFVLGCAHVADNKKLDDLLVSGEGFIFSVKEPSGWNADTSNASSINANIIFYRPGETIQTSKALIFVRVNKKYDEHVEKDLSWDMDQYRKQHPSIQFKDILVTHPEYKIYPKLFYISNRFYEYVTYINPGEGKPVTISVAMNIQKDEASEEVFNAYGQIVKTIILLKP